MEGILPDHDWEKNIVNEYPREVRKTIKKHVNLSFY